MTSPPSTGLICEPPTRSNQPSPPFACGIAAPKATAAAALASRWSSSLFSPPPNAGGYSTALNCYPTSSAESLSKTDFTPTKPPPNSTQPSTTFDNNSSPSSPALSGSGQLLIARGEDYRLTACQPIGGRHIA